MVPAGLSYCNRCGADLRPRETSVAKRREASPDSLVAAIVFVTIFGLGAIIGLMVIMKWVVQSGEGQIYGFAFITFLMLLLIDALFAWLLLRSKKSTRENIDIIQLKETIRAELQANPTSGLSEPVASVTDHTTRTLEPVEIHK